MTKYVIRPDVAIRPAYPHGLRHLTDTGLAVIQPL